MTTCCGWYWPTLPISNGCTVSTSRDYRMSPACNRVSRCARCSTRASCRCAKLLSGCLVIGLQRQNEIYFHGVSHLISALPVALPGAKIQTFEFGAPLERRACAGLFELKIDRHILRHAAQGQSSHRRITGGGFAEAARDVVRGRRVRHVEDIRTADGRVAILVHRIDRIQVDLHVEMRARERIRCEHDVRAEFMENAFEFGAGLQADEFQAAL